MPASCLLDDFGTPAMRMKPWNIAITGFGAMGRAVADLVWQRREHFIKRHGADVRIVGVCGSRAGRADPGGITRELAGDPATLVPGLTGDRFLDGVQADVLFEAGPSDPETGGAGYLYMRAALAKRMHVVAISKGGLVFDYAGLAALATAHGVRLKISGATSAALPTIDLLQYNLAGCRVLEVEGIFTATTNFLLSRMMEGDRFADALAQAQGLGMAEPDPRFDIEGWDTACKVAILANAAFDAGISLRDIPRDGITPLSASQIDGWRSAGQVPKLVGRIVNGPGGVRASVELRAYPAGHPFAQVGAGMKAIRVETDTMGEVLAIGRSGPVATAAAAMKDFEHLLMQAAG